MTPAEFAVERTIAKQLELVVRCIDARENPLRPAWIDAYPSSLILSAPRGVADCVIVTEYPKNIQGVDAMPLRYAARYASRVRAFVRDEEEEGHWSSSDGLRTAGGIGPVLAQMQPGLVIELWPIDTSIARGARACGHAHIGISDAMAPDSRYPGVLSMADWLHMQWCEGL